SFAGRGAPRTAARKYARDEAGRAALRRAPAGRRAGAAGSPGCARLGAEGHGDAARAAGGQGPAATQIGPEPTPAEPTGSPRAPAATRSRADGCREPAGPAGHARAARARRAPGSDAAPDGRRADGQRAGARSRNAAARGEPLAARHCDYRSARLLIVFGILKDGRVPTLEVAQQSGYAVYDDYAANAIRLAQPFPPVPASLMATAKSGSSGVKIVAAYQYVLVE